MKQAISSYKNIVVRWICAAVYLWALELRTVIGTEREPLTAWLADCASILLTFSYYDWYEPKLQPSAFFYRFVDRRDRRPGLDGWSWPRSRHTTAR